jgi:hypothetical protein
VEGFSFHFDGRQTNFLFAGNREVLFASFPSGLYTVLPFFGTLGNDTNRYGRETNCRNRGKR